MLISWTLGMAWERSAGAKSISHGVSTWSGNFSDGPVFGVRLWKDTTQQIPRLFVAGPGTAHEHQSTLFRGQMLKLWW
jgi:hypothetical protein